MAIVRDATSTSGGGQNGGTSTTTWAHTVSSGNDRYLLVSVNAYADTPGVLVNGVTFNGVSMTRLERSTSTYECLDLYGLVAPDSGAHDIVVTYSMTGVYYADNAVSYTGVHPTAPTRTPQTNSGSSQYPSLALTSANGEVGVDCTTQGTSNGAPTVTGTNQYRLQEQHNNGYQVGGMSDIPCVGATTTMSWNMNVSTSWRQIAVALKPATGLPPDWVNADVGSVGVPGTGIESGGTYTLEGSGSDIYNTTDQFHFVYKAVDNTTNWQLIARITSIENTNAWAKAGVMVRAGLATGSKMGMVAMSYSNGRFGAYRDTTDAKDRLSDGPAVAFSSTYLRIRYYKDFDQFSVATSTNGTMWQAMEIIPVSMGTSFYAGLVVTSHDNANLCTAVFDNVAFSSFTPEPLPTYWYSTEVGAPDIAGTTSFSGGTGTLEGDSADLLPTGTADNYHFVYSMIPTGQVIDLSARVVSIENTHAFAKAGVMIRGASPGATPLAALNPDAVFAASVLTYSNGFRGQRRLTAGAASVTTTGAAGSAPQYVRVKYDPAVTKVYMYSSANGTDWTEIVNATVTIGPTADVQQNYVYFGLFVTSHDIALLCTGVFDTIMLNGTAIGYNPTLDVSAVPYGRMMSSLFGGESEGQAYGTDWLSHTIKVGLLGASYTPSTSHVLWTDVSASEVSGGSYQAGGIALQNKAISYNSSTKKLTIDADDVVFDDSHSARYAIVYNSNGSKPLLGYVDFGAAQPTGTEFLLEWSSTGIFEIAVG